MCNMGRGGSIDIQISTTNPSSLDLVRHKNNQLDPPPRSREAK